MPMKRFRENGQQSKEDYHQESTEPTSFQNTWNKATPGTLASRKIVTAKRYNRKSEFIKHLHALNQSFHDWVVSEVQLDPCADLVEGFQDYLDHLALLENRYLRKFGEVLTFGSGDCGQLAHGVDNMEDLMVPFPRIVYSLRDKKVVGIACGGIHNAVYTETGQVYTWGCADDGSLGRTGDESTPMLVEDIANENIVGVACGDGQTLAITSDGHVWGWGAYKDREGKKWFNPSLSATNRSKDIMKQQNTPLRIEGLDNIVEAVCGTAFNLALRADGTIFSWGIGEFGELGRKIPPIKATSSSTGQPEYDYDVILKHHITPGHMHISEGSGSLVKVQNVKSFGCGSNHSIVVLVGGSVYSCGLNNYGQLGHGVKNNEGKDVLTEISTLDHKGVIIVTGGQHHSLVLCANGEVYAFGRADSGQLGIMLKDANRMSTDSTEVSNAPGEFYGLPIRPYLPEDTNVTAIASGGNHNLVITKSNEVYTWGYGDMYQLGHGMEKDELLPNKINFSKAKIKNIQVTQVAGGGQHSAIIGQVITSS